MHKDPFSAVLEYRMCSTDGLDRSQHAKLIGGYSPYFLHALGAERTLQV